MKLLAIVTAAALSACSAAAQSRPVNAAPATCRADLERLCASATDGQSLRTCVRAHFAELSAPCRQSIRAMRADRQAQAANPSPDQEEAGRSTDTPSIAPTRADLVYRDAPAGAPDSAVSLDFYAAEGSGPAPLVVFVHGGAWQTGDKRGGERGHPGIFTQAGYAYASVNYRMLEYGRPEIAADDIAAAIAYLRTHADSLNVDPDKIILMGHSAGAHLAALTALDTRYLTDHAVAPSSVRALVLLDGAGYDIARQVAEGGNGDLYRQVFGDDDAYWRRMSPLTYAGRPQAPATLAHYVSTRSASGAQAQALVDAIRGAGGRAEIHAAENETHASINRGFGEPGDETTARTMQFLAEVIAR